MNSNPGAESFTAGREEQLSKWDEDITPPQEDMKFEGIKTIGHLVDVGFARSGDLLVKFRIPYRFRHDAMGICDAWNVPLDIRIKTWQLYDDLRGLSDDE